MSSRSWEGERKITIDVSLSTTRPFGSAIPEPQDDGSRVWLVVHLSDSGPGIPLDDQARLFTRFNDVHSGNGVRRSSSLGGTGLGLYLCKKLAELQGGQIRHSSIPGQGAAFHFFIEARRVLEAGVRRVIQPPLLSGGLARSGNTTPTSKLTPHDIFGHDANDAVAMLCAQSASPLPSPIYEVPRSSMLILIVEDNVGLVDLLN